MLKAHCPNSPPLYKLKKSDTIFFNLLARILLLYLIHYCNKRFALFSYSGKFDCLRHKGNHSCIHLTKQNQVLVKITVGFNTKSMPTIPIHTGKNDQYNHQARCLFPFIYQNQKDLYFSFNDRAQRHDFCSITNIMLYEIFHLLHKFFYQQNQINSDNNWLLQL